MECGVWTAFLRMLIAYRLAVPCGVAKGVCDMGRSYGIVARLEPTFERRTWVPSNAPRVV